MTAMGAAHARGASRCQLHMCIQPQCPGNLLNRADGRVLTRALELGHLPLRYICPLRELGLRQPFLGSRPPNLERDRESRVDPDGTQPATGRSAAMNLRFGGRLTIDEVSLEPSLERFLRCDGKRVAALCEGLAAGAIREFCEPAFTFARNVRGVFHGLPAADVDASLVFDRLECAGREVFARVRHCYHARLARMLVLVMITFRVTEIRAVGEKQSG